MLQHGYINPPVRTAGPQMVAVTRGGAVQVQEVGAASGYTTYVASANYILAGLETVNLVVLNGTENWDAVFTARSNALATAELYEWYAGYAGGVAVHVRPLVRPSGGVDPAAPTTALMATTGGVGGNLLAEDIDTMVGCVLGGAMDFASAPRWRMLTNTEYAVEVTDLSGAASAVNITVVLYRPVT